MSPPGRPKGEFRSAQHEGTPMTLRARCTASILLIGAGLATAQTPVYRCGPDGRAYSQQPCPGGTQFDAADPRNAAQRAQAVDAAERERRHATSLERDRLAREAAERPSRAVGLDSRRAAPPPPAASRPTGSVQKKAARPAAPDANFTAINPAPSRKPRGS